MNAARARSTALFAGASFAAALLIFLVQPMVGKRILPWFGGVPAVWMLCLAFFQTTLFAGYAYAHCLIRYAPPRAQIVVHAIAIAASLAVLPVLPGDAWKPDGSGAPSPAILSMLAAHVALPFLVLAATAPLVQAWFARAHPAQSPYPLYAVSNTGSLLALLAYPFWIEVHLPLSTTARAWSVAFALTGLSVLACGIVTWRRVAGRAAPPAAPAARLEPGRSALWILLAGCAVVVLMGITSEVCLDVASVPFLWVLPLAVYLISFVLCFGSERSYRRVPWAAVTGLALVGLSQRGGPAMALAGSIQFQVACYLLLLLGFCMLLHGELYRLRPAARDLTAFYLCVSGGGALGGLFVGLVAPLLFDDYYELQLGLVGGGLLVLVAWWRDPRIRPWRNAPRRRAAALTALAVIGVGFALDSATKRRAHTIHRERTFFGVLRVREDALKGGPLRSLLHGTTVHGVQLLHAPARPTKYYGVETGIGLAMRERVPGDPARIGVIGLGVGTLAAYGRPEDHVRFYEIDPAVVRIASKGGYFSYLERSLAEIEIVEGDGRISLARERARGGPRLDYLVVDAYSSDAVPIHLLTREALELYVDSLTDSGLLAVHTSSRHFELRPLLSRMGAEAGLAVVSIQTAHVPRALSAPAVWVFLSRDGGAIRRLERATRRRAQALGRPDHARINRLPPGKLDAAPMWTDDYSDLFAVLRPLRHLVAPDRDSDPGGQ